MRGVQVHDHCHLRIRLSMMEGEHLRIIELLYLDRGFVGQLPISLRQLDMPFSCSMSESSGFARRRPLRPSTTRVSGLFIKCLAINQWEDN